MVVLGVSSASHRHQMAAGDSFASSGPNWFDELKQRRLSIFTRAINPGKATFLKVGVFIEAYDVLNLEPVADHFLFGIDASFSDGSRYPVRGAFEVVAFTMPKNQANTNTSDDSSTPSR